MPEHILPTGEGPRDNAGSRFLGRLFRLLPGGPRIGSDDPETEYPPTVDQAVDESQQVEDSPTEEVEDQPVLVVHVQPLGRIEFLDSQGREKYPATTHHNPRTAGRLHANLAALYIPTGPGEHSLSEITPLLAV